MFLVFFPGTSSAAARRGLINLRAQILTRISPANTSSVSFTRAGGRAEADGVCVCVLN